jgi:hypothetical protein
MQCSLFHNLFNDFAPIFPSEKVHFDVIKSTFFVNIDLMEVHHNLKQKSNKITGKNNFKTCRLNNDEKMRKFHTVT